jgi:hypothetical protein
MNAIRPWPSCTEPAWVPNSIPLRVAVRLPVTASLTYTRFAVGSAVTSQRWRAVRVTAGAADAGTAIAVGDEGDEPREDEGGEETWRSSRHGTPGVQCLMRVV